MTDALLTSKNGKTFLVLLANPYEKKGTHMRIRNFAVGAIATTALAGYVASPAIGAIAVPTPATSVCSQDNYACLSVNQAKIPAGQTVIFKGSLNKTAMKNLAAWTLGDNIVCLTRYNAKPQAEGWPSTTLDGACAQANKAGRFTINAELGTKGLHYFGVEMGPCQGDAGLCGNGDPGLVGGGGKTAVALTTT